MDRARAEALLAAQRTQVQLLLDETTAAAQQDTATANEPGDLTDPAERLTAKEGDDAVAEQLRDRLDALARAERRLADGTFGKSVRSGKPIPDERLEADPAAELTADEANES